MSEFDSNIKHASCIAPMWARVLLEGAVIGLGPDFCSQQNCDWRKLAHGLLPNADCSFSLRQLNKSCIIDTSNSYVPIISDYAEFKSCGEAYHCSNHLCISKELLCDGVNNCADSSDELATKPANCGTGL